LYRGISDFTKGDQPGTETCIVKDEKGDLATYCHSILAGWRNHFSQLLNAYVLDVVRHTEIHTAERTVPEFYMAIEKIKSHKSPDIDQTPAELGQEVKQFALRSINLLILFEYRGTV
jgi:hypothetical protein